MARIQSHKYSRATRYYNGTAQIEVNITRAAESYKNCSNAISKRFIRELSGIFVVTPPSNNESNANSINMITGFWPLGFDFTDLQDYDWQWYYESDLNHRYESRNPKWTLASFE